MAALLCQQGYHVVGLTLQLWNQRRLAGHEGMPESVQGRCCSIDDVYDARRVAETLGIPYYVVNQEERFEQRRGATVREANIFPGARPFLAACATTT